MHGVAAARLGAGAMMIAWVCAAAQAPVLDVETHRAPIDEVIAAIYARCQG